MTYTETNNRLAAYRREIGEIRKRMRALQEEIEPEPVRDYDFERVSGTVSLSALFGSRHELFLIHNMGISCPYCTVWADGYNGVYPHLASRAAFAIVGPDAPLRQAEFARARGWRFPFLSHQNTTFAEDMGYRNESGRFVPGLSVFRKRADGIVRIGDAQVEPGCDFSPVCRLFEFLPGGAQGWTPRLEYDE